LRLPRAGRQAHDGADGLEAKTIHRLLEIDPKHGGLLANEENPLDCDLLVVDETSMVDVPLMNALTRAIPAHAGLLLVGDVDQLPSVGPGQVLADVIASERSAGRASHRGVPAGGREPDRGQRPPHQHGQDAGAAEGGEESDFYVSRSPSPRRASPS
jgi:exodeoxyribonuclease V alpha subunit